MERMFLRGEIYYADLGTGVGSEQEGCRPVVIVQNDLGNRHSPTVIVAAITSKLDKNKIPTHVPVTVAGLGKNSVVLLEQIRTVDKSRLKGFVGMLEGSVMEEIDRALLISLGIRKSTI